MWNKIDESERKVLIIACLVSAGHLFLIAYAAIFLQISVPTCQPNEKLFDQAELRSVGENRYEIHYLARMWSFEPKKLMIPVGSTVDFFLGSKDVNHGFHINGTNVNLMAVPGVINKGTHTFKKSGIYHIVCHEYCGFGHQNMSAEIVVSESARVASMDPDSIGSKSATDAGSSPEALAGKKIYQEKGCVGCHSLDGTVGVAPSFKSLWGRAEELVGGAKVFVDEAYISESIKNPKAKVTKGFTPIMPMLGLTDDEIKNITEFIKTLK